MSKNEIIPRGSLDTIGECQRCRKLSRLHLMEITVNGKTEHFSLCLECYEKLIDIALDEELI